MMTKRVAALFLLAAFVALAMAAHSTPSAWAHYGDRDSTKDFDTLSAAGNNSPAGLYSDGTTMWVADETDSKIYAYTVSTKARDTSKEFDTLSAAGNDHPRGLYSDGTTMWVSDHLDDKIYAYAVSTKARDTSKEFDTLLAAGNLHPYGLYSDGTTMWVADEDDDQIYAYAVSTKARDTSKEISLSGTTNNLRGLDSDGTTLWVAEDTVDRLFAFTLSTSQADASKTIHPGGGNDNLEGIYTDGTTMWVADSDDDKLYAYDAAITVPDAPSNLTATAGNTKVKLTWSTPGNTGSALTGYDVGRSYAAYDSGNVDDNDSYTKASAAAVNLPALSSNDAFERVSASFGGHLYRLKRDAATVRFDYTSYNSGNTQGFYWSDTLPDSVVDGTHPSWGVTWNPHNTQNSTASLSTAQPQGRYYWIGGTGTPSITSTRIRAQAGAGYGWTSIGWVGEYHTVTGLTNNTAYTFKVRAVNGIGAGAASSPVSATPVITVPDRVSNLTATAGDQQVTLDWDAPADDGGSDIIRYEYQQDYGDWTSTGSANPGYTVTGLTNGTRYRFHVRAVNSVGNGLQSARKIIKLPDYPGAPTNLTATAGNTQVILSWTAPADDGGSDVTGYEYEQDTGGWTATGSTDTTYTKTGLTNGTRYRFKVRAVNTLGGGTASASVSATPSTIPGVPGSFMAIPTDREVILRWTAPDDGGSDILRYEYQENGGDWTTTGGTGLEFIRSNLTNGTSYAFAVRAVNANGNGAPTASASAVPATIPDAPSGMAAAAGTGSAVLSWTAPSFTGGATITGYEYQQDGGSWTGTGSANPGYTVTGLTDGVRYVFRVRAVNSAGASLPSGEAGVIPGHLEITVGAGTGADDGRYGYSAPGGYGSASGVLSGILFTDSQPRTVSSLFEGESGGKPYWQLSYSGGAEDAFKSSQGLGAVVMQAKYGDGKDNSSFVMGGFVDVDNSTGRHLVLRPPLASSAWSGRAGQKVSLVFMVSAPAPAPPAPPNAVPGIVAPTPEPGVDPSGRRGEFTRLFLDTSMGDVVSQIAITVIATAMLMFTPKISMSAKLNLILLSLVFTPWVPAAFGMGSLFLASMVSVIIVLGWLFNKVILRVRGYAG